MYSLLNPDLRRAGIITPHQLEQHWNKRGKREHRPMTFQQKYPHFNHAQYQKNYPDLKHLNRHQLEMHWLKFGVKQFRTFRSVQENKSKVAAKNDHIRIFTEIYEKEKWGKTDHEDFKGSPGKLSEVDYSIGSYIPFMKRFLQVNNIKRVVDIGCGNFEWAAPIYEDFPGIHYHGIEAYGDLVKHNQHLFPGKTFTHLDALHQKEKLPTADLCILKDVLQHWSNQDIYTFLDYLVKTKKFKIILIVNCCRQVKDDTDIATGGFRELDAGHLPLKKYNIQKIYNYITKEVSLIFT